MSSAVPLRCLLMSGASATGYGVVAKTLHWLTVAAFVLQFVVGYAMSTETDCDPPGEDRSGGDTSDAEEERIDRLEEACETRVGDEDSLGTAWSDLWGGSIAAHIAFFVALGAHLLLVPRRGLLPRMLPGAAYGRKGRV